MNTTQSHKSKILDPITGEARESEYVTMSGWAIDLCQAMHWGTPHQRNPKFTSVQRLPKSAMNATDTIERFQLVRAMNELIYEAKERGYPDTIEYRGVLWTRVTHDTYEATVNVRVMTDRPGEGE